jgi:hypothetical protein
LIRALFGVRYHVDHMPRLLAMIGGGAHPRVRSAFPGRRRARPKRAAKRRPSTSTSDR